MCEKKIGHVLAHPVSATSDVAHGWACGLTFAQDGQSHVRRLPREDGKSAVILCQFRTFAYPVLCALSSLSHHVASAGIAIGHAKENLTYPSFSKYYWCLGIIVRYHIMASDGLELTKDNTIL